MPLDDVNQATFQREAERVLRDADRVKAIANFAKLKTPDERLQAFRGLRGGSLTSAPSTKLGNSTHTA